MRKSFATIFTMLICIVLWATPALARPDAARLAEKTIGQFEDAASLHMDMMVYYGIDPLLWPPRDLATLSVDVLRGPVLMRIQGTQDDRTILAYVQQDETDVGLYAQVDDQWRRQRAATIPEAMGVLGIASPETLLTYLRGAEKWKCTEETEQYEGREVYHLSAQLKADYIQATAHLFGLSGGTHAESLTRDKKLSLPMTVLVDVKTQNIAYIRVDLGHYLAALMQSSGASVSAVSSAVEAAFSQYDSVETFTVPAEAAGAFMPPPPSAR